MFFEKNSNRKIIFLDLLILAFRSILHLKIVKPLVQILYLFHYYFIYGLTVIGPFLNKYYVSISFSIFTQWTKFWCENKCQKVLTKTRCRSIEIFLWFGIFLSESCTLAERESAINSLQFFKGKIGTKFEISDIIERIW